MCKCWWTLLSHWQGSVISLLRIIHTYTLAVTNILFLILTCSSTVWTLKLLIFADSCNYGDIFLLMYRIWDIVLLAGLNEAAVDVEIFKRWKIKMISLSSIHIYIWRTFKYWNKQSNKARPKNILILLCFNLSSHADIATQKSLFLFECAIGLLDDFGQVSFLPWLLFPQPMQIMILTSFLKCFAILGWKVLPKSLVVLLLYPLYSYAIQGQ